MGDDPIQIESDRFRLDLTMEYRGQRPDGTTLLELKPDPERYEWRDEDDGRVLFDRRTEFAFPESVVEQMKDLPIHAPPPGIPEPDALLEARKAVIAAGLAEDADPGRWADPASEAFSARVGQDLGFAIVSVDLVGSTRLQAADSEAYNALVPVLAREIADISTVFGGC